MNLLRRIFLQIKSNPITLFTFVIGYSISILGFSIILSDVIYKKQLAFEYTEGTLKNSIEMSILNIQNKDISKDLFSSVSEISKDSFLEFKIDSIPSDNVIGDTLFYNINAIYFGGQAKQTLPMLNGKFLTSKNIDKKENVAVVGKALENICYEKEGEKFIDIYNETYKVVGTTGFENASSYWDRDVFIPITSKAVTKYPLKSELMRFKLTSAEGTQADDIESITNNLNKLSEFNVTCTELDNSKSILSNIIYENQGMIDLIVFTGLFSIVNLIVLSSYWVKDREKEIGIRKALGINNLQISIMLVLEFLMIAILAALLAIFIQGLLSVVLVNYCDYSLKIYKENYIYISIISFFTAGITSIIPIIKSFKITPVDHIRNSL